MFASGSHIPYVCDVIIETQTISEQETWNTKTKQYGTLH
jgi:hypothetical protein